MAADEDFLIGAADLTLAAETETGATIFDLDLITGATFDLGLDLDFLTEELLNLETPIFFFGNLEIELEEDISD